MKNFDVQKFSKAVSHDKRTLEMFRYLVNNAYIRVVNYHNTNPIDTKRLEAEIAYFSEHFSSVSIEDVNEFFVTRKWNKEKPGLIPAIFEGYRNHYDVMLPILEKYNFKGWFYLPSFYMDVPVGEQLAFGKAHELDITAPETYPDCRYALNWDEVREIAKKHEICCHTGNHFQIDKTTSDADMHREIVESKRHLEAEIGRPVDVFCWLYGEEYNYNIRAHKYLEEAGYKYVVSNLKIEKIR
ncbi:MAG: polysaccharide deacetylase family protein [Ruthenibacterium sp.]